MIAIIVPSAITSSGLKHLKSGARGYSRNLTVSCLRVRKRLCFYLETVLGRLDRRAFGSEAHVRKPRIFKNRAEPVWLYRVHESGESVVFRDDGSVRQNAAQARIERAFGFHQSEKFAELS